MGVRVKSWKGAWWIFIDHQRQRRARRVGVGTRGKKLADDLAIKIQARLLEGDRSIFAARRAPLGQNAPTTQVGQSSACSIALRTPPGRFAR